MAETGSLSPATCWCRQVFPLTQEQNVHASWLLPVCSVFRGNSQSYSSLMSVWCVTGFSLQPVLTEAGLKCHSFQWHTMLNHSDQQTSQPTAWQIKVFVFVWERLYGCGHSPTAQVAANYSYRKQYDRDMYLDMDIVCVGRQMSLGTHFDKTPPDTCHA